MQHIAVYVRVSTRKQDTRSQKPDLERWAEAFANGQSVKWYRDSATGKNMNRPGWQKLESDIDAGKVSSVVVWRLDRLGRTASGLTALFEKLTKLGVNLVSVRDSIDLKTASGRLIANVLASVASYETEVRAERVLAGQAVARANGKAWGGSVKGRRISVSPEQVATVHKLKREGVGISAIARTVSLSRPTIYRLLNEAKLTTK